MPPIRLCRRDSSMRSVRERGAAWGGVDAEALELRIAAGTAGLQPDLVQAQDVQVRVPPGALTDLVERIDHRLELLRQLREHGREHPPPAPRDGLRQLAVGPPPHGNVIVDVDEFRRET